MSDQKYLLLTKENAEVILNKVRRLSWDDANEVMAIIKDLKLVRITDGEEESHAVEHSLELDDRVPPIAKKEDEPATLDMFPFVDEFTK